MLQIEYQRIDYFTNEFLGHGGSRAAEYVKLHLFQNLIEHSKFEDEPTVAIRQLPLA